MHLPAQAAAVHVPRPSAGDDGHAPRGVAVGVRDRGQSTGAQRQAEVVAGSVKSGRGGGRKALVTPGRVMLVLVGFVLVAIGVIARRTFGISQATALRSLETQRDAAAAARIKLETEIRDASSRARLGPIAEKRLHMYVPSDSQVIILRRPR